MSGFLIAGGVIVSSFLVFVLYDQRKNIFKKRNKDEKKQKVKEKNSKEIKAEEVKKAVENTEKKVDISFERRESKISNQTTNANIEEVDVNIEERKEYNTMGGSRGFRRSMPQRPPIEFPRQPNFSSPKSGNSIREQIDNLSPEMKAILMANVLGKKDDLF